MMLAFVIEQSKIVHPVHSVARRRKRRCGRLQGQLHGIEDGSKKDEDGHGNRQRQPEEFSLLLLRHISRYFFSSCARHRYAARVAEAVLRYTIAGSSHAAAGRAM